MSAVFFFVFFSQLLAKPEDSEMPTGNFKVSAVSCQLFVKLVGTGLSTENRIVWVVFFSNIDEDSPPRTVH